MTKDKYKWLLAGEAAEFLGVNPTTLTRWRWQDKIHPQKNPFNGYWEYSLKELKKIKDQINFDIRGKK